MIFGNIYDGILNEGNILSCLSIVKRSQVDKVFNSKINKKYCERRVVWRGMVRSCVCGVKCEARRKGERDCA
jgi:hypothetical protein